MCYIEIEMTNNEFAGIGTKQNIQVRDIVCAKCRLTRSNPNTDGVCGFCTSVAVREVKESLWRKVLARFFK